MTGVSLSEIVIEVIPKPDIGKITVWSIKDSTGRTVCFFEASSQLKECSHYLSTAEHIQVNYKIAGEWPGGSTELFESYGYNNARDRKLLRGFGFASQISTTPRHLNYCDAI